METMTGTGGVVLERGRTKQIELFDEESRLIGVISRPVRPEVLGPGRDKVYLSREEPRGDRSSNAA